MKRRRSLLIAQQSQDTGYKSQYLTIVSEADSNAIGWKTGYANSARTISISTDGGKTWTTATSTTGGVTLATLNTGDTLLVKGTNTEYYDEGGSWNSPRANMFTSSGNFHLEGNIMSLVYGDDFKDQFTLTAANTFRYMFYNCSKLTTAENCIMPATTLTSSCYDRMFSNCTILTKAPTLPATTLVSGCYSYMFNGSRALNYIRCLAVDHSASNCTNNWVQNVASSGTFVKAKNASWSRGNSAVPSSWTLDDYGCGIEWSASTFTTYMNNTSNKPTFSNPNNLPVTFSSSDTSVATVNSSGVVSIIGLGVTTLTATFAGNSEFDAETVTCVYTIAKAAAGIAWSASTYSADPESSNKPTFSNPNNLSVTFSSSNTSVATVSNAGVITYVGEGTATITASFAGNSAYNSSTVTCALTLAIDYSARYLTIVSLEDNNSIYWETLANYTTGDCEISLDNGVTWTTKTATQATPCATLNSGQKLLMRKLKSFNQILSYKTFDTKLEYFYRIRPTKRFNVEGNILSLTYGNNFSGITEILEEQGLTADTFYGFYSLFSNTKVVDAKNLILPLNSFKWHYGISGSSVQYLNRIYSNMFYNCSLLKTAPKLPAYDLSSECYAYMFSGCISLEIAPKLPAVPLNSDCYYRMFYGCTNLRYIKARFTTTPGTNYTSGWVDGVAGTGVFVKNRNATWDVTGNDGVPTGWTVVNDDQFGYIIDQRDPTAASTDMIIKPDGHSMNLSSDDDVIAWINAETKIVAAEPTLSSGNLVCYETSRTDKTKYKNGTSISNITNYDLFVKLPEFWWCCTELATDMYLLAFSKTEVSDWNHWEGNTFIGVYEAYNNSSKVYSRSGVTPTVSVSQTNFKTYARRRGTGYTIISYEAHCMMALLGYGWIGQTDVQSVCGKGTSSHSKTTGGCNSLGITDTAAGGNGDRGSINFWGIENWWGDIYEWVDNLVTANSSRLVNINDLSGTTVRTVQSPITSSGCIGKMMLGEYGDMIPKETHSNSSYNNGFCDYGYVNASSGFVASRSSSGAIASGGLGYLFLYYSSGDSYSNFGSRLQYKGSYTLS